jgi:hypothetical protein
MRAIFQPGQHLPMTKLLELQGWPRSAMKPDLIEPFAAAAAQLLRCQRRSSVWWELRLASALKSAVCDDGGGKV